MPSAPKKITKYEPCSVFSLALPESGSHRLEQVFADSLGSEPLEDVCSCGAPRGSRAKHTELLPERTPQVLVLHLKRWAWSGAEQAYVKNPVHVSYETLFPLLPGAAYDLRSVIVHRGSAGGHGHYVCYVRADDNFWYLCDDRARPARQTTMAAVLNQEAYMLIYEKR